MIDISIVLPVFNVASYLSKCLESIRLQTFSNWELLIIDDGSSDESGSICDKYASMDGRIKVIHQKNMGVSHARNVGIENIKAPYAIFLDADDYIENIMLETMYQVIIRENADIVCCNYYIESLKRKNSKNKWNLKKLKFNYEEAMESLQVFGNFDVYIWNKLIKVSNVLTNKFREDITLGEDYIFLCENIHPQIKIVCIDEHLYHYVKRLESACNVGYSEKYYYSVICMKKFANEMITKCPSIESSIISYYLVQELTVLTGMIKNNSAYDISIIEQVKADIKQQYMKCCFNRKISLFFRGSLLICGISPNLFMSLYKISKKRW